MICDASPSPTDVKSICERVTTAVACESCKVSSRDESSNIVISVDVASRGGFAPVQSTSAFPLKRPSTRLARSPSCIAISNHPLLELPPIGLALTVYNLDQFAGKRKLGEPDTLLA